MKTFLVGFGLALFLPLCFSNASIAQPPSSSFINADCKKYLGRDNQYGCSTFEAYDLCVKAVARDNVELCVMWGQNASWFRYGTRGSAKRALLKDGRCYEIGATDRYVCPEVLPFADCIGYWNAQLVSGCQKTVSNFMLDRPENYVSLYGTGCKTQCAPSDPKCPARKNAACVMDKSLRSSIREMDAGIHASVPLFERYSACTYSRMKAQAEKKGGTVPNFLSDILYAVATNILPPADFAPPNGHPPITKFSFEAVAQKACNNYYLERNLF